jgi:archaetidylinositol phosphate synthase
LRKLSSSIIFITIKRINNSPISQYEESILKKIVPIVPNWITPDVLTYFAFSAMLLSGILYFIYPDHNYYLLIISFCIVVNWLADSLDGKIAKYRGISRPEYGDYLDHGFDVFSLAVIGLGLSFSKAANTHAWFVFTVIILAAFAINFLKAGITHIFYLSMFGVGPTDARIFLIFLNLVLFIVGNRNIVFAGYNITLFDMFGIVSTAILGVVLVYEFVVTSSRLAKISPKE